MKKTFITNLIVVLVTIGILITVVTVSYGFIADKILEKNIGDELKVVQNSTIYSFETKLESDYQYLEENITEAIKNITDEDAQTRVNKKLEVLESLSKQILFTGSIHSGFGGYVKRDSQYAFYINGIYYKELNGGFKDLNEADTFTIVNFGDSTECKVEEGKTSEFENKPYIVYKFDEIIVYIDARSYFEELYEKSDLVEFENIFIIYPDGKCSYQKLGSEIGVFYQMLTHEFTEPGIVDEIREKLNPEGGLKDTICVSNVRYNGDLCYLLASNLSTDSYHTNLCLVSLISFERASTPIKQAVVPLVAGYSIIVIVVTLFLFGSYLFLSKKSNDIDIMVYQRYNEPVYKVKVNKNGKILTMNGKLKKLLVNHSEFKSVNDFNFTEKYNDYVIAVFTQKPLTIKLTAQQVVSGETIYLRCIVLRYFGNYIMTCVNATSDENERNMFKNLALYNHTTQLPNAELFKNEIANYIEQINTKKNKGLISLAFINIKNHDSFQHRYGKFMTDNIVIKTKEKLESLIDPRSMTLYSIDESIFGLTMDDLENYDAATKFAQDIIDVFKKPIEVKNNNLILDLTFAVYNLDLETFTSEDPNVIYQSLVKLNDKVKKSYTTEIEVYSLAIERQHVTDDKDELALQYAVDNNEFVLYLQPQYNIKDKRICGAELLLRWNNPNYFSQSPLKYIEKAEKNGLIKKLSMFINEESMKIAKRLETLDVEVSINVSPAQLAENGFVSDLIAVANKHEVNKSKIALEITETFGIQDMQSTIDKLNELRKAGFMIHLDDFGTGYSSMLYLKDLPFDSMKIDKEFTKGINIDVESKAIVGELISLALALGKEVIAEGVEDEKQLQFLEQKKCTRIQGFLISKAVPYEKFEDLVKGYNIYKTITVGKKK